MSNTAKKTLSRLRRRVRVRAKIKGSASRPRLSVFRSNNSLYVQLIDDEAGRTLAGARMEEVAKRKGMKPVEAAAELGKLIAQKAGQKKIVSVVFDRGGNRFHGRVKAVADGARAGGLEF